MLVTNLERLHIRIERLQQMLSFQQFAVFVLVICETVTGAGRHLRRQTLIRRSLIVCSLDTSLATSLARLSAHIPQHNSRLQPGHSP